MIMSWIMQLQCGGRVNVLEAIGVQVSGKYNLYAHSVFIAAYLNTGLPEERENPDFFTSEDRQGFRLSGYFSAYPGFGFAGLLCPGPPDFHWLPGGTERGT